MADRFSLLSNEDLQAIAANDWSRVSTRGLQIVAGETPTRAPEAAAPEEPREAPEYRYSQLPKDISLKLASGIGKLVAFPGQLYGLATGDFEPTGALGLGTRIQERAAARLSPELRAKEEFEAERIRKIEAERGQLAAFKAAAAGTLTDPALLLGTVAESIPSMVPGIGAGIGVGRAVAGRAAAKGAEAAAARAAGTAAGVGTAKGISAVQQGTEVGAESYKQLFDEFRRQGLDEPEAAKRTLNAARAAGASGSIISYLAQSLPGSSALERALISGEGRAVGRIAAGLAGAIKETPGEMLEEGGGRATQNVALREAIPDQPISAGVGEAAGRAAAAAIGLGGGVGALQGRAAPPTAAAPPPPPPPAGPQGAPPAPPSGQGELFTEAEAPRAPTPEGLAQNKAYYDALNNQLTQLTREQQTLRAQASQTSDPAAQEQLRKQSVAVTEQIANVSGEMARYAPTIPSIAQEPRIDTEARAEEAERTADLQAKRREFDTLQRENERLKAEYERAAALEDRVQRVRETMRIRAEAERLAPSLAALQEDIQRDRRALPTQATQRAPAAEGQLDLRFGDEIRLEDLTASGIPVEGGTNQQRAVRSWFRDNVIGKTPADLRAMVAKDPSLTEGTGLRARAIQQILAPEPTPPAFEEKPRAPVSVPPADVPAAPVQPELDFGGTGAGVEVSGRAAQPAVPAGAPTQPQAAQPGGLGSRGVPAAPRTGEPAAPSGQLDLDFTAAPATAPAPTTGSAVSRFNPAEVQKQKAPEYKGKERLIEMPIDVFLQLAEKGDDPTKLKNAQDLLAQGKAFSTLPYLYFDVEGNTARVSGHEGRHRAKALKALGYTTMPVSLRGPIRWSEQADSTLFDYKAEWPGRLLAQEGAANPNFSVPFPVTRETAAAPYESTSAVAAPAQEAAPDQEAAKAAKKAEAAAKRKAAAEAKRAEAEARKAEADARKAEEEARQAEAAAKQAEEEAKQREEEERTRRVAETARKGQLKQAGAKWREYADPDTQPKWADLSDEQKERWREAIEAGRPTIALAEEIAPPQVEPVAAAPDVNLPEWAKADLRKRGATFVSFDGKNLIYRTFGDRGSDFFSLASKDVTVNFYDVNTIDKQSFRFFSKAEVQAAARAIAQFQNEDALQAKAYPEGPFTGAKQGVVGDSDVDPKYVAYLQELINKLNLNLPGGQPLRIFLRGKTLSDDARTESKLYGAYRYASYPLEGYGHTIKVGPLRRDFVIAVDFDTAPEAALSTLGHEFGHVIEMTMLASAPVEVQNAIRAEYDKWLAARPRDESALDFFKSRSSPFFVKTTQEEAKAKGMDLAAAQAANLSSYWRQFNEWFADQVSRWATTEDKPLSVVEKFFASVAAKMRKLVALVDKRESAPAASVKKFLDEMYARRGAGLQAIQSWHALPTSGTPKAQPLLAVDSPVEVAELRSLSSLMNPNGGTSLGMGQSATDFVTKFRTRVADKGATALEAVSKDFNGAVRNALGQASLEPLYRQAEASDQLIPAYLRLGSLAKDKATGLWRAVAKPNLQPPAEVINIVRTWADSQNMSFQKAYDEAGKIMESARQKEFKDLNASMAKGREFPVSMSDADINKYYGIYSADPTFHRTLRKILDDARFDLIDNMVKVGRIPQEMADDWKTATAYIPFDREGVNDLDSYFRSGRRLGRGIAQVGKANPQLVDAPLIDRPVKNALDNYFNWMGWGVRQVVQADATIRTLRELEKVGQARFLPGGAAQVNSNNKQRVVKAYSKGNEVYFETPSAYHAAAFNIQIAPLPGLFNVMSQFSQVLRTAITAVPTFTATQVPQDIQRAIMYSGVKDAAMLTARTLANFTEYSKAAALGTLPQITHELGEYGVAGDFDFRTDEAADSFLRSMGAKPRRGGVVGEFVHRMSDIARASDFALRRAIYEQTLYEGGDQLLALHRAREIINFRRYGMGDQLGIVHMLTQVIPFYNAYIQGMDVLYRSLTGKDAPSGQERGAALKQFYTSAAYVTSVAVLYSLAKAGDDEYENMDLRERDKTWVIGDGFGIPVPGELGMIFKALPERVLEAMRKQGTPDEAVAAEAVISWFKAAFDEYSGRGYMPASFKPLIENITNYSFLSGRALEGTYQAGLLPSERTTSRTSELSKNIARFTADTTGVQVSPIKIDNFLQGYLGTTAGLLFATTDAMMNPDRIDRPLHQMVGLTAFTYDPVGTRRASEFYDLREKVVQTQNTLNSLMKEDLGRAADFAEKNADKLMLYKAVNSTLKEIERTRAYRNWLSSSDAAQSLTQKERAQQMEEIKRYEQQMFEWTRDVRNYLKL